MVTGAALATGRTIRPPRVHISGPGPDRAALARAVATIRDAAQPLIVAGGGVVYAEAVAALRAFVDATGVPVAETQVGKGALPFDHPLALGALGATGTQAANLLAREADVVIGIGTRWSDFTTASHTAFADPDVQFVNVNVTGFDAAKNAAIPGVADARVTLEEMTTALAGWMVSSHYRNHAEAQVRAWSAVVDHAYAANASAPLLAQSAVIGAVNEVAESRAVVVCAAGSIPGDLHKLWRAPDPKGYHVEYGLLMHGLRDRRWPRVKMADPDRQVFVLVGDGSYLMMAQELLTAVQEHLKLVVVLVQNHGFASIGRLSQSVGAQRFGTDYRYRGESGRLDGAALPIDLAANAESLDADVLRATTLEDSAQPLRTAAGSDRTTVIHVETDPMLFPPDSDAW